MKEEEENDESTIDKELAEMQKKVKAEENVVTNDEKLIQ
jgi:hypothetical protein